MLLADRIRRIQPTTHALAVRDVIHTTDVRLCSTSESVGAAADRLVRTIALGVLARDRMGRSQHENQGPEHARTRQEERRA